MDDLDKVMKILKEANKAKGKMDPQQYMDMMVCLKGIEAKFRQLKFRPCRPGELKVGDKVRVRDPKVVGDKSKTYAWIPEMDYSIGKTTTISKKVDGNTEAYFLETNIGRRSRGPAYELHFLEKVN